ncbi:C-signal-like [Panulirus ornatus]|uniref:C-signal-like n=1 Tax=Panulirus ornatus TaxID=150431 RepID=UPI003A8A171C
MLAGSVLITGCSRGLGLEMVRQLVTSDDPPKVVIALCRSPENAFKLQTLAKDHKMVKILKFDVMDYKRLPEIVEEVRAEVGKGGLNLLINNAAVMEMSSQEPGIPLEQLEPQEVNRIMETNATAPLMLVKAMLPLLRTAAGAGGAMGVDRAAVINVSSILGSLGSYLDKPNLYCYRASKAALNMVTKALAVGYGGEGLLFAAINPGWVKTDMGTSLAPTTPEQCITKVFRVLSTLGKEHNGCLVSTEGEIESW